MTVTLSPDPASPVWACSPPGPPAAIPVVDGLQAQGDLIVIPLAMLADVWMPGTRPLDPVRPEGVELLRGEAGGNPHTLVAEDGTCRWTRQYATPRGSPWASSTPPPSPTSSTRNTALPASPRARTWSAASAIRSGAVAARRRLTLVWASGLVTGAGWITTGERPGHVSVPRAWASRPTPGAANVPRHRPAHGRHRTRAPYRRDSTAERPRTSPGGPVRRRVWPTVLVGDDPASVTYVRMKQRPVREGRHRARGTSGCRPPPRPPNSSTPSPPCPRTPGRTASCCSTRSGRTSTSAPRSRPSPRTRTSTG